MTFNDFELMFDRALSFSLNKKKFLLVFTILVFCGVLAIFFRGLALAANEWLLMSFTFLPIFLCSSILLSTGIVLIRIYHDEVKKKEAHAMGQVKLQVSFPEFAPTLRCLSAIAFFLSASVLEAANSS